LYASLALFFLFFSFASQEDDGLDSENIWGIQLFSEWLLFLNPFLHLPQARDGW